MSDGAPSARGGASKPTAPERTAWSRAALLTTLTGVLLVGLWWSARGSDDSEPMRPATAVSSAAVSGPGGDTAGGEQQGSPRARSASVSALPAESAEGLERASADAAAGVDPSFSEARGDMALPAQAEATPPAPPEQRFHPRSAKVPQRLVLSRQLAEFAEHRKLDAGSLEHSLSPRALGERLTPPARSRESD